MLNTELVAFLTSLRPRRRLATLSNDWPGGRAYNERHYRLSEVLAADAMLYSCEEGLMKPVRAFYVRACARLDVKPGQAVFVDNLTDCLDGARRAGLATVLYTEPRQTIADLYVMCR